MTMEQSTYTYSDLVGSVKKAYADADLFCDRNKLGFVDSITHISPGSFLSRTLDQYNDLLCGNTRETLEDIIDNLPTRNIKVLDIGGGAGYALMKLKVLFPHIEPHLSDERNTPLNIVDGNGLQLGKLHGQHHVIFHHLHHLKLFRNRELHKQFMLITSVFSAYDDTNGPLWPFFLKRLPRLLAPGGKALVFNGISPTLHKTTEAMLKNWGMHYEFHECTSFEPHESQRGKKFGTTIIYA